MGESIINFYKTKIKREYKIAFVVSIIAALIIHIYKFTNTLPNHDSLYNYYSDQNGLGSGRWALSLACGISSYFDLPWINGLMSCLFLALTVVVIVALLKIKNPVLIALTGGLLAASPSTTETFFFMFTADGYIISMFLAALAVYLSRIEEKRILCNIAASVCICISCGIYQAYVSFALILAVCYFINVLLHNSYNKEECIKWIVRQVVIYVVALASYYVIWKLCMHLSGVVANNYQGISEVGNISVSTLINGIIGSVASVAIYFLQWNVLEHGFTLYSVLSIIFIIVFVMGIVIAFIKSKLYKRKWAVALIVLCLLAIIPFSCIWHFASASVSYRPMMLQSLTLLFVLTAILYEDWFGTKFKNIVCAFLIIIIFNNGLMANICYFYMNLCYERTYAEGVEMMSEIHDLQDEYEFDKIAVVGKRIQEVQYDDSGSKTEGLQNTRQIHMLSTLLEKTLLYDSDHTTKFLNATFGLELETLNSEQRNELFDTEEVQSMGCWPEGNSITVIDDILVIKLSDKKE